MSRFRSVIKYEAVRESNTSVALADELVMAIIKDILVTDIEFGTGVDIMYTAKVINNWISRVFVESDRSIKEKRELHRRTNEMLEWLFDEAELRESRESRDSKEYTLKDLEDIL